MLLAIIFIPSLLLGQNAWAQERPEFHLLEQKIKAGLLYNFIKNIHWPEGSVSSEYFTACIFGDDPFAQDIAPMSGRTVSQKKIAILRIGQAADVGSCNMVFIGGKERSQWAGLRQALEGRGILSVSDFPGFTSSGGMIGFGKKDSHIGAGFNMQAISGAGLQVDPKLLELSGIETVQPGGVE